MIAFAEGTLSTARQHYLEGFLAGTGRVRRDNGIAADSPAAQGASVESAPLSWEEHVKGTLHPFDAFSRLLVCAATDQPPSAADRFRFQWFGLFYQGPENDAFVLRLRLPGGRLKGCQWLGLAKIVQELAGGVVECNAQGGLDLPGIPVRACAEALRRVETIGLSSRGTGGDCVRAVRGGEREGIVPGEPPSIYQRVCALEQVLAQSREFGDLPGPCEIEFRAAGEALPTSGDAAACLVFQASRAAPAKTVWPVDWPPGEAVAAPVWQVLPPGGGELGVALADAEVLPFCLALLRFWSRQADRTRREQAALGEFCVRLGAGKLRAALERELGKPLASSGEIVASAGSTEAALAIPVPGHRLLSAQMVALAHLAARCGVDEFRLVRPGCLLVPGGADADAFGAVLRRLPVPALSGEAAGAAD